MAVGPVCLLRFPSLPGSEPSPSCLCHSCWPHSSDIVYVHSYYKLQQNGIITVFSMQQQFNDSQLHSFDDNDDEKDDSIKFRA